MTRDSIDKVVKARGESSGIVLELYWSRRTALLARWSSRSKTTTTYLWTGLPHDSRVRCAESPSSFT
jgi:hypothetical protein